MSLLLLQRIGMLPEASCPVARYLEQGEQEAHEHFHSVKEAPKKNLVLTFVP